MPLPADVTRRASQLLLAHRGLLTPPQLARLSAKMAEVGMTSELKDLVASSVASGSHAGQAVGFVAAALTGEAGGELAAGKMECTVAAGLFTGGCCFGLLGVTGWRTGWSYLADAVGHASAGSVCKMLQSRVCDKPQNHDLFHCVCRRPGVVAAGSAAEQHRCAGSTAGQHLQAPQCPGHRAGLEQRLAAYWQHGGGTHHQQLRVLWCHTVRAVK